MRDRISLMWKLGSTIITWLLIVASAPTKFVSLKPIYEFLAAHWSHIWFRLICALVATVLIFIFEIVEYFSPKVDVQLTPSGYGSSELVLRVTNMSNWQGSFSATCEVICSRETSGIPIDKTVNLKWEGANSQQVQISPNASESLLIASQDNNLSIDISWIRLWGIDGSDKKQLTAQAWNRIPTENMPELDLKICIFREGSINPKTAYFTVRPASYIGPLEMILAEAPAKATRRLLASAARRAKSA